MKTRIITISLGLSLLLASCSRKSSPPASAPSATAPVASPLIVAWKQGDKSVAISHFVETDWNSRPLFASGSACNLTEAQFRALPREKQQQESEEMIAEITSLKELAAATAQAGRDAAWNGDKAQARKYFAALQQCGAALDSSTYSLLVQKVGQALKRISDAELKNL